MKYITIQGDTWDMAAVKSGKTEVFAGAIMAANYDKLEYYIFPAGIELRIPETAPEDEAAPAWRKSDG